MTENALLMPSEVVENKIFFVRGKKVMFQLTKEEGDSLRFQIGISKRGEHSKYPPRAFTQERRVASPLKVRGFTPRGLIEGSYERAWGREGRQSGAGRGLNKSVPFVFTRGCQ